MNGKAPATAHSFKDASCDLAQIDAWWSAADYNVAVEPDRLGMAVIDVDVLAGGDATPYPATFSVTTPSGGKHLYYAGEAPPSVRKIAAGIDTRGRGGYVLLPPSHVVERAKGYQGAYIFPEGVSALPEAWELPSLPEWVASALSATTAEPRQAPADVEIDKPLAIEEAKRYLRGKPIVGENEDGDDYPVIARLKDYGLSFETIARLLVEHGAEDCDWLYKTIANTLQYGQNEPGSDVPLSGAEKFGAVAVEHERPSRFQRRDPDEYAAMRDLEFWDADKTLPKMAAVAVVYGAWGSHKTNTVLTMLLDAVEHGARVIYAAGEGAYGVGKQRIPAHCAKRGIDLTSLRGKFGIVPAVPLLANNSDIEEFIETQIDMKPHIVVLDTLATAIAGEDENSSRAAAMLTANGPVGRIRDALNALVILVAHQGKDASKGIRGHSGLEGNVDVILHVEAHDSGGIKVIVEKMRDGRDGFSVFFKVPPKGGNEVPVPEHTTEKEYLNITGEADHGDNLGLRVAGLLRQYERVGFARGWTDQEMAECLAEYTAGRRPDDPDTDGEWLTAVHAERKALQKAVAPSQTKKWTVGLFSAQVLPGGKIPTRRWHLPS